VLADNQDCGRRRTLEAENGLRRRPPSLMTVLSSCRRRHATAAVDRVASRPQRSCRRRTTINRVRPKPENPARERVLFRRASRMSASIRRPTCASRVIARPAHNRRCRGNASPGLPRRPLRAASGLKRSTARSKRSSPRIIIVGGRHHGRSKPLKRSPNGSRTGCVHPGRGWPSDAKIAGVLEARRPAGFRASGFDRFSGTVAADGSSRVRGDRGSRRRWRRCGSCTWAASAHFVGEPTAPSIPGGRPDLR